MQRSDGSLFIHSFAHGRGIYELVSDASSIKAALNGLKGAALIDAFVERMGCAKLDTVDEAELIDWVSEAAEIGKMPIKRRLKDARAAAARKRAREERDR
jgi:hypothetical protein